MANVEAESQLNITRENGVETDEKNNNGPVVSASVISSLLLVVAEPLNVEQKDLILERIVTELSNWDSEKSGCDLSQQIQSLQNFQPSIQDGSKSYKTDIGHLKLTILINPRVEVVFEELQSVLLTPSKYKYLLHSGPVLMNSGAWMLSDGTFSFQNFCQVLKRSAVTEALTKAPEALIDLSFVRPSNEWTEAAFNKVNPKLKIRLTRPTRTLSDESGLIKFSDHISTFLTTPSIGDRLQSASLKGAISFDQPTAYIFPAGQGDSFLFGVTGFTILIDGGYSKSSCFYNLVRHLTRLDAVIMSRMSPDNMLGLSSFFEKQALDKHNPAIGTVMLNIGDARHKLTPSETIDAQKTTSGLIVSLAEEGRLMAEHLTLLNLIPSTGVGYSFTNLYYKVGHGSLDMYVVSPQLESKEFKDFLASWSKAVDSYKGGVPVSDNMSISCVMLWRPAAHLKESVVRMLFPGRISLQKLAEGLEKLKTVISFQTHTGVAASKKPAPGVKQTVSRLSAKAPSSASLDKNKEAKKVGVEVKKTAARKALPAKSPSKAKAESDAKETKTTKTTEAKTARKGDDLKATSPTKPTQKTTARPLKAANLVDKKEAKVPSKPLRQSEKQSPLTRKSPKSAQPTKAAQPKDLQKTAQKSDKKVLDKQKLAKSAEKPKPIRSPFKKDTSGDAKSSPEKQELTETQKSPEKVESVEGTKAEELKAVENAEVVSAVGDGVKESLSEKEREKVDEDKEVEECKSSLPHPAAPALHKEFDPTKEWDAPLKLPSPAKESSDISEVEVKKAPTDTKTGKTHKKPASHEDMKIASRTGKTEARKPPLKALTAFHVDLSYIPLHADVDFFRRVRARYYVLSSSNPDQNILPNLIEARGTWDEAENWEVCVVPTQQSQVLLSWLATLNESLVECNIKVTPPASRCSISIQEPDQACDAYRIPFN